MKMIYADDDDDDDNDYNDDDNILVVDKVALVRCVQVELKVGELACVEGGKTEKPNKNSRSKEENKK